MNIWILLSNFLWSFICLSPSLLPKTKKMKRSNEIFLKIVCVIVSSSIFILLYAGISTTFGVFGNEVEFPLGIIL